MCMIRAAFKLNEYYPEDVIVKLYSIICPIFLKMVCKNLTQLFGKTKTYTLIKS